MHTLAFCFTPPLTHVVDRAQKLADAAKSAAATELVSKQQAGGTGAGLIGGALDREVVQLLFKKWLRSNDKDEVIYSTVV